MKIVKLSKKEWEEYSEQAHLVVFNEKKDAKKDRVDFALVCENEFKVPLGYATCYEADADTLYLQYGGAFPTLRGQGRSDIHFSKAIGWIKERYKRIYFFVENTNLAMLKISLSHGFLITGIRNHSGKILVEHTLEFV